MKQLVTFVTLALLTRIGFANELVEIYLKEQVTLSKPMFQLFDIAVLSGADKSIIDDLNKLEIGYAPRKGYSKIYTTDEVEAVVLRAYRKPIQIKWVTNTSSQVKNIGVELKLSSLDEMIKSDVLTRLKQQDDGRSTFSIKNVKTKDAVYLSAGGYQSTLSFPDRMRVDESLTILLDIHQQGKRVISTPVTVELEITRPVYTLTKTMTQRSDIKLSDVRLIEKNVTAYYDKVIAPDFKFDQTMLFSDQVENTVLLKKHVVTKPLVMKGELTQITVIAEKVNIMTQAIAQNDAHLGGGVVLMNSNGTTFGGIAVAKGMVYVQ